MASQQILLSTKAADIQQGQPDYNHGSQPDEGTTDVYIIDTISGHCGSNPSPTWIDQTEATRNGGAIGRWTSRGRF